VKGTEAAWRSTVNLATSIVHHVLRPLRAARTRRSSRVARRSRSSGRGDPPQEPDPADLAERFSFYSGGRITAADVGAQ
jgi:hypothetical protein